MAFANLKLDSFSDQQEAVVKALASDAIKHSDWSRSSIAPNALLTESYPGELEELRRQASWLNHLVDTMPVGLIVLDGHGTIARSNQIAIELLGEPLEGEKWFAVIQRAFRPQHDDGHEVSLKNGRRIKLDISPLSPEPGQLVLFTDLTQTRQLQERLAHMQRLSALGKMVASLAHQVRTPLSAAMLYAANLGTDKLPMAVKDSFHSKLMSRLQDLESQVNDMLLFARSDQQQVVKALSLQTLLSEVKAGSEAMVQRSQGRLDVILPEPDIEITGNKTALASAIQNLIHNSIQVIGEGAHIVITAERLKQEPEQVIISVQDNGPGIDEANRKKIFEPFYTTRSQGTGLGLAVVNSVAISHGGHVWLADSEQGAHFKIQLPLSASSEKEE